MKNQEIYNTERAKYMHGFIGHDEFYLWLAGFIDATSAMVPFTRQQINASKDPHMNDLSLRLWDNCNPRLRTLAYRKGIAWSLSDTVCTLKALARTMKG